MMARKPKHETPPEVSPVDRDGWVRETRTYRLITPLFGGGEETQKADSITTVRATEVRGHLRFWWRATRGGLCGGSLEEMKKREEAIWGSPAEKGKPGPSPVRIQVIPLNKGKRFQATARDGSNITNIGHPNSKDGYAAFPLRDSPAPIVLDEIEFQLKIDYRRELPDSTKMDEEVNEALWAWETFGGIAARTRRGFGALRLTQINEEPVPETKGDEVEKKIAEKNKAYGGRKYKWPAGVPHLGGMAGTKFFRNSSGLDAWRKGVQKLRDFRQLFRDPKNGKPFGRSHWPEPDSVRQILHDAGVYTYGRHVPKHPVQKKFPRAKFGLPIRFEFPDIGARDPETTTLQGIHLPGNENRYIDRLASPLILRSIECDDGAIGLALVLKWETINSDEPHTPPGGLLLTGGGYGDFAVESELDPVEAAGIPALNGDPDVLHAFLDYFVK